MASVAVVLPATGVPLPGAAGAGVARAATAPATGGAGVFTPAQTRLFDSRTGTSPGPLAPNTWTSVGVTNAVDSTSGAALFPYGSNPHLSAVAVTVTAVGATSPGAMQAAPNTATAGTQGEVLQYLPGETVSNTAMIAVGTDGQIAVKVSAAVNVIVEMQGYYSSGSTLAPGGFVPLANTRYVDTRQAPGSATSTLVGKLTPGTIYNLRMRDVAGIPGTANAVFANITALASGPANSLGSLTIWPANTNEPTAQTSFPGNNVTGIGRTLDSNSAGDVSIQLSGNAGPIDLIIDIQGYFDAQPSTNGFTPTSTRIFDSGTTDLTPNSDTTIQVTGVNGLPAAAPNLAAFALNLTVANTTNASGYITAYPGDVATAPGTSNLNISPSANYPSSLALVRTSSTGTIKIRYAGDQPIRIVIDTQGYYTNSGLLGFPYGNNGIAAGDRSAAAMVSHQLTDQIRSAWNPTTGNMLLTGKLLALPGIAGTGVNISWRYNSINDLRPTLSVGRYENALQVQANGDVRYIDATGGINTFGNLGGGQYSMPPGVNATLTKSTSNAIDQYRLRFNTTSITNLYMGDGAIYPLTAVRDSTSDTPNAAPRNGTTVDYANGRISGITDSQGRTISFAYNDTRNLVQPSLITDNSLNRTIALVYGGPGGALTQITDTAGGVTTLGYDANNKLNQVTDPKNQVTQVTYTGAKATTLAYAVGTPAAQTFTAAYPNATTTTLTGPSATAGTATTTTYTYDTAASGTSRVTKVVDPNGNTTQAGFDTHDNQTSTINGLNQTSTSEFDATKNVLSKATDPGVGTAGTSQTYTYGTASGDPRTNYRPATGKDDQGNTTTYSYDPNSSNITSVATAWGVHGTLTRTYTGSNGASSSCTAPQGQLCNSTDGKGQVTTYTWDSTKNLTKITPPAPLGATVMTYDAAGRVATKTDGNNNTATYTYDALDRLTRVTYGSNGSCSAATCTTWTFDPVGNLTQRVDASGTTTFTYDAQNRVTGKTLGPDTTSVAYDQAGNISRYTDSAGQVTYSYDNAHRQISLAEPNGSCPTTKPAFPNTTGCTWFDYDQANHRTATTFPTGFVNTTVYDNAGKIASITGKTSAGATTNAVARSYTYNPGPSGSDGTIRSSVTDTAGVATTYGYDGFRQLTSATTSGTTETWTYDLNGNRTSDAKTATPTQYSTYNAADQLCNTSTTSTATCTTTPTGGTGYAYDANGNTTGAGTSTYANNVYNQVTTATTGGTATGFGYAATSNTERTSAGDTSFLNGVLGITKQTTSNGPTLNYIRDAAGTLIAMRYNGVSNYYTTDALGSVIYLSTGNNGAATSYTYDAFGKTTSAIGDLATTNPYRYATGYYDTQTGLTKMGARYYDPTLGRFTQPDPSGQESNQFLYARANPVNFGDPTGFNAFSDYVSGAFDAASSAGLQGGYDGAVTGAVGGAVAGFFGAGPLGVVPGAFSGATQGAVGGFILGFAQGVATYTAGYSMG